MHVTLIVIHFTPCISPRAETWKKVLKTKVHLHVHHFSTSSNATKITLVHEKNFSYQNNVNQTGNHETNRKPRNRHFFDKMCPFVLLVSITECKMIFDLNKPNKKLEKTLYIMNIPTRIFHYFDHFFRFIWHLKMLNKFSCWHTFKIWWWIRR